MINRKISPIVTLVLVLQMAVPAMAAKKVEVLLTSHEEAITGYLREISQSRYILQSGDSFFQFTADELIAVGGKKYPAKEDLGQGRLVSSTLYERVLPNGDVEIFSTMDAANTGTKMIRSVDWGAAEWELEEVRAMEVRDAFGNLLPPKVSRRDNGSYQVEVVLEVPVAPLENLNLSVKRLRRQGAKESDSGTWTYTFNVDFSEDRFFVRKIEFPQGAKVEVPNGWRIHDMDGRVFLFSSFYFPAHTVSPQVIEYRLH